MYKIWLRTKRIGYNNQLQIVQRGLAILLYKESRIITVRDHTPGPFYSMLGQTHVNGWSRIIASQNGDSTDYIFLFKLRVLQWSRYLFNYWDK